MSKAASSVLGRSAPAKTRFVRSTRVCSHEHRLVRSAQATPETFCTPPKRYRARNHHIEVALRVRAGDIIAAPPWPPRPVHRDEVWLRAPLNLAPTLPARSAWSGALLLGILFLAYHCGYPRWSRRRGHGCDEQARVLAGTSPAERGRVENVCVCNKRRAVQRRLVGMQAAGSVSATHTHR